MHINRNVKLYIDSAFRGNKNFVRGIPAGIGGRLARHRSALDARAGADVVLAAGAGEGAFDDPAPFRGSATP